jgi:hypothetical protein
MKQHVVLLYARLTLWTCGTSGVRIRWRLGLWRRGNLHLNRTNACKLASKSRNPYLVILFQRRQQGLVVLQRRLELLQLCVAFLMIKTYISREYLDIRGSFQLLALIRDLDRLASALLYSAVDLSILLNNKANYTSIK